MNHGKKKKLAQGIILPGNQGPHRNHSLIIGIPEGTPPEPAASSPKCREGRLPGGAALQQSGLSGKKRKLAMCREAMSFLQQSLPRLLESIIIHLHMYLEDSSSPVAIATMATRVSVLADYTILLRANIK